MATTAQLAPGFDAIAADAMELHSDDVFDVGDGDIDIDLGSARGSQVGGDDALSLQDAATDGGTDMHDASADMDDYMIDKEDLIEEDEIDYDDVEIEDAGQTNHAEPVPPPADTTNLDPNPSSHVSENQDDEDLIDYSDEEDQDDQPTEGSGPHVPNTQERHTPVLDHGSVDDPAASKIPHTSVNDGQVEDADAPEKSAGHDEVPKQVSTSDFGHEGYAYTHSGNAVPEEAAQTDVHDEQLNVEQHESRLEEQSESGQVDHSPHEPQALEDSRYAEQEEPQRDVDSSAPLRVVTINYNGTELWLFRPFNSKDDDWLLEDESLAAQNFHSLFSACRASLGDDINNETEIGFRFDNFHGMELFEDCTACAYSTLKEFLDIYETLHAQDGATDPEPLYITLQLRPRFYSLVSELKKAVEDGIGFSGLNNAITSGQSKFNQTLFDAEDIEDYEESWGEEEHEENQEPDQHADAETRHEEEATAHAEVGSTEQHGGGECNGATPPMGDLATTTAAASDSAGEPKVEGDVDVSQSAPVNQTDMSPSVLPRENEQREEELIGFSDEEDEGSAARNRQSPVAAGTSDSSTMRGDDVAVAEEELADGDHHEEPQGNDELNEGQYDKQDSEPEHQDQFSPDADESYEQFEEAEEDGTVHVDGQESSEAYGQGHDVANYPNQDTAEEEHSHAYDKEEATANGGAGEDQDLHAFDTFQVEEFEDGEFQFDNLDDNEDVDGTLDFDDTEDASAIPGDDGEDLINFDDDESAEDEASGVVSSTAPPPIAPSTGGLDPASSPQGLKRSLDEVDVGSDGAGDSSDAKKPKL